MLIEYPGQLRSPLYVRDDVSILLKDRIWYDNKNFAQSLRLLYKQYDGKGFENPI